VTTRTTGRLPACQAKFNVPRTIARVNDPENVRLFRRWHRRRGVGDRAAHGADRAELSGSDHDTGALDAGVARKAISSPSPTMMLQEAELVREPLRAQLLLLQQVTS